MDKETEEFAAKVLLSIQQAKRGEFARLQAERAALLGKALSFRMTKPYGKKFERKDAYRR